MKKLITTITLIFSITANSQSTLPNISLNSLDGKEINIQEISSNDKIAVVSLWATWCVPCIKELDAISEYYEDWKDEVDFELFAISTDDSRTINRVNAISITINATIHTPTALTVELKSNACRTATVIAANCNIKTKGSTKNPTIGTNLNMTSKPGA